MKRREDTPVWPALAGVALVLAIMRWHVWSIVSADAVVYAAWAYTHPFRACWWCGGTGKNRWSTKSRWGTCWRCRGRRQVKTIGSRMLHLVVRRMSDQVSEWRQR